MPHSKRDSYPSIGLRTKSDNREFKKLRQLLQRNRHIEIELLR